MGNYITLFMETKGVCPRCGGKEADGLRYLKELLALLTEKREVFLACEVCTTRLCICEVDEVAEQVAGRQSALDRVEELDRQMQTLCQGDEAAWAALHQSCDRQGLSIELGQLYDASLETKAVVNRILQNEDTVRGRLELVKKKLMEKIEGLNKSGSSVASRYGRSIQAGISRPIPLRRDKMI